MGGTLGEGRSTRVEMGDEAGLMHEPHKDFALATVNAELLAVMELLSFIK
jgi:hypothetical protein